MSEETHDDGTTSEATATAEAPTAETPRPRTLTFGGYQCDEPEPAPPAAPTEPARPEGEPKAGG